MLDITQNLDIGERVRIHFNNKPSRDITLGSSFTKKSGKRGNDLLGDGFYVEGTLSETGSGRVSLEDCEVIYNYPLTNDAVKGLEMFKEDAKIHNYDKQLNELRNATDENTKERIIEYLTNNAQYSKAKCETLDIPTAAILTAESLGYVDDSADKPYDGSNLEVFAEDEIEEEDHFEYEVDGESEDDNVSYKNQIMDVVKTACPTEDDIPEFINDHEYIGEKVFISFNDMGKEGNSGLASCLLKQNGEILYENLNSGAYLTGNLISSSHGELVIDEFSLMQNSSEEDKGAVNKFSSYNPSESYQGIVIPREVVETLRVSEDYDSMN